VKRRSFIASLLALSGLRAAEAQEQGLPPAPNWRPSFSQPLEQVVDRMTYYTDAKVDLVAFKNGTCVYIENNLPEAEARAFALKTLSDIINFHPDMRPTMMDDGNVLVQYNHPAVNVVLQNVVETHWNEIEERHLDGLVDAEVLITPLGPNKFDQLGKQALLGRAYMFMDAQAPEIAVFKRRA
jgi:hypothetical protein